MMNKVKKFIPVLLGIGILLAFLIFFQGTLASANGRLGVLRAEVAELKNEIDRVKAEKNKIQAQALHQATGLDATRQAKDDQVMTGIFRDVLSWSDSESYLASKAKLLEYGMKKSEVEKLFPAPEVIKLDSGESVSSIDHYRLNLRYEDHESHVVGITGTSYSYVTEVTVSSNSQLDGGGYTALGTILARYTIDYQNEVTDLSLAVVSNR